VVVVVVVNGGCVVAMAATSASHSCVNTSHAARHAPYSDVFCNNLCLWREEKAPHLQTKQNQKSSVEAARQRTKDVARLMLSVSFLTSSMMARTEGDSSWAMRAAMRRRWGGVILAGSISVLAEIPVDSTVDFAYLCNRKRKQNHAGGGHAIHVWL